MKKYVIVIDEGTTSVRAILYDVNKHKIVKLTREKIELISPKFNWVELDAQDLWNKTLKCLKDVTYGLDLDDVYGLGITNQRETIVAWDKRNGKPLANAIVWKCNRTAKQTEILKKSKYATLIRNKTGLIVNSYFSATKMQWLLENVKAVKKASKNNNLCFGTIESYLVYRLTQNTVFVTDVTNASRTMLFNIKTLNWDDQLLKLFKIHKKYLAKPVDNDKVVGYTTLLGKSIKIAGLIGDQQSSLFGQGCFNEGNIKNTYGTGCFMLVNTGTKYIKSHHNLLTTIALRIDNRTTYALEGSIFYGSNIFNRAITSGLAKNYRKLTRLAMKVKANDTWVIPGDNGLGAPYWIMNAKTQTINWDTASNKDKAFALFKACAYENYDVFEAMQKDTNYKFDYVCVDGGFALNKYLMQKQTDIFQTPIKVMNLESTAMGAIICTCLATKAINSLDELTFKPIKTYKVKKSFKEIEVELNQWKNIMLNYIKEFK